MGQYRLRQRHEITFDFVNLFNPRQCHSHIQFKPENFQYPLYAFLSIICEAPEDRSPDENHFGTQCNCFENIGSKCDASIKINFSLAANSSNNAMQGSDCRGDSVQLSGPMVGYEDTINAHIYCLER